MRYQFHEHKRISRLSLSIVDFPVFTRYRLTRETIFIRAIHCVKQPRQYVSSKLKFQFTQKVFRIREQCGLTTERLEKLKQRYAIFNALLEFSVRFKVSGNFFIDESQRFGKNISKNSKKISIKMHFSNFQFRYII